MTKGTRQGMIKRQPQEPEELKVKNDKNQFIPDCTLCQYGRVGEYQLIHCERPLQRRTIPQPNCKSRKTTCIYYKKKEV